MYKKLILMIGTFAMMLFVWQLPANAETVASLHRSDSQTIVDQVNMLSQATKNKINQYNDSLRKTAVGGKIVVLTVNNTDGESIDNYSNDLLHQPDWQHFDDKNKFISIIIFAKNNGKNNVRITTSRNAQIIISDSTALSYLQNNYDALKSSSVVDNNNGLQRVLDAVHQSMAAATVKQVNDGLQQQADNEQISILFSKIIVGLVGIFLFGMMVYWIGCGIEALKHLHTASSEWYETMLDPMREDDHTASAGRAPLNYTNTGKGASYYTDKAGKKYYVRSADLVNKWLSLPRTAKQRADYQIAKLFKSLAPASVYMSIDSPHYFQIKGDFSEYGLAEGLIDEVIKLKGLIHFTRERNDLTSFTYRSVKYYVSQDMMKFFNEPTVRTLFELGVIKSLTPVDIHKYYGVTEDYSDPNELPFGIYTKMFPNEKTYQLWRNNELPSKKNFTLRDDRYVSNYNDDIYLYPSMMYSIYPTADPNYSYSSDSGSSSGGGDAGGGGGASI